ncbi:DNA topoisomerase 6 subunit A [Orobanche hederae]
MGGCFSSYRTGAYRDGNPYLVTEYRESWVVVSLPTEPAHTPQRSGASPLPPPPSPSSSYSATKAKTQKASKTKRRRASPKIKAPSSSSGIHHVISDIPYIISDIPASYNPSPSEMVEIIQRAFEGPIYKEPPYKAADLKPDSDIITILERSKTLPLPPQVHSLPRSAREPIFPDEIGVVIGKLIYCDDGYEIDCSNGTNIPWGNLNLVTNMTKDDALFILLVGNRSVFQKLARDRFYESFRCIILTAEGPPDFLIKMEKDLNLPVLALVDSHPHWLKMLVFYGRRLNNIKWLGIRPSDMVKHNMSVHDCTFRLTKTDSTTAKRLLNDDYVKNRPRWLDELDTMLKIKQKAEIQSLSCFGMAYLTQVFLPMKLQQEDWI